jgi:hypothetical protein
MGGWQNYSYKSSGAALQMVCVVVYALDDGQHYYVRESDVWLGAHQIKRFFHNFLTRIRKFFEMDL